MDDGRAVADLVADLLVELGIREAPDAEAAELRALVAGPWARYRSDAAARSVLTPSGAPFEVSLKLAGDGAMSLRYVVDVADQRHGLLGNRARYRDGGVAIAGAAGPVDELLDRHLTGAAGDEPPGVMHGVGLAAGGRRRASLYFPASRRTPAELVARLPAPVARATGVGAGRPVEVVGYDLTDGTVSRWKTYQWLPVGALGDAGHPDLRPAVGLHDAFAASVPAAARGHAMFLQLAGGDGPEIGARAFFFCRPWGWSTPDGLASALALLHTATEVDLGPLVRFRRVTARHGARLTLGLLAVGGDPVRPSVTFYFWPA